MQKTNLLLIENELSTLDFLTNLIESEIECEILVAQSQEQAFDLIEKTMDIDLIVCSDSIGDEHCIEIYQKNLTLNNNPFLFISSMDIVHHHIFQNLKNDNELNVFIPRPIDGPGLLNMLKNTIHSSQNTGLIQDLEDVPYRRVNIERFLLLNKKHFDVYLRLNKQKFIKMTHKGDDLNNELVEKLKEKNQKYIFLKIQDHQAFLEEMLSIQSHDLTNINTECLVHAQLQTIQNLQEILLGFGMSPLVANKIDDCIDSISKQIKENKKLTKLLAHLLDYQSDSAKFVTMTSYIGGALLAHERPGDDSFIKKICLAALYVDISLKQFEMIKVRDQLDLETSAFSEGQKHIILEHPTKSLQLYQKHTQSDFDVEKIIEDHHQRFNNNGFPRKATGHSLSDLTKSFIAASETAFKLLTSSDEIITSATLKGIIQSLKDYFNDDTMTNKMLKIEEILISN